MKSGGGGEGGAWRGVRTGDGRPHAFKRLLAALDTHRQRVTRGHYGEPLRGAEQQDEDANPGAGHLAGTGAGGRTLVRRALRAWKGNKTQEEEP